jgi:hypothetical protein
MQISEECTDFSEMDDYALFGRRAELRDQLARLSPQSPEYVQLTMLYDVSTAEVNERARAAWARPSEE